MAIQLEHGWNEVLRAEFEKPYMIELKLFLEREKAAGKLIFPPGKFIFQALNLCPFNQVKVIILGQDPYHGQGQAHGLSFSVPEGIALPPSLKNIDKELKTDLGISANHGDLSKWALQGVLLLNAILTVRASEPGSHQKKGWESFTDTIITKLNEGREGLVFILWGAYARSKKSLIDVGKHEILESVHPSPLSAYSGFFGSRPFSQANSFLEKRGIKPIDWQR